MKQAFILFVLFMFGMTIMVVTGRYITLSWWETGFLIGVIITVATSTLLAGVDIWSEEEQQSS